MHLMTNLIRLKSVGDVVRAWGGTAAMADWAGVGQPAISNWIAKNYIPPGWHYRIYREAVARGYDIEEAVFDDRLRVRGVPTGNVHRIAG